MSIDCNQGINIKLFPELCCSKGLISLLFRDITVKLLVIACTFRTPIVSTGSKTERSSSQQSEDAVDAKIRARDEQLLVAQQELNREIKQLKQQEIAASRQGAENAHKMREALQKRADNAEKCVSQIRARQHSDEELARAAEAYQQHRRGWMGTNA